MSTIRVALAEDNVLLREGVSRLVSAHPDFELVGTASDLPELLAVIESSEPDVVITDIRMPPTGRDEGIQAAAWLRLARVSRLLNYSWLEGTDPGGLNYDDYRAFLAAVVRKKLGLRLESEKRDGERVYRVVACKASGDATSVPSA